MTKQRAIIVVWVFLGVAMGFASYAAGANRSHAMMIRMLQAEAAGNLGQRIEVLSLLQIGDVPGAIARLESETDVLTRTIAENQGADQRALAYMKTYLSVAPTSPERARALEPSLSGVTVLTPSQCKTALQALLLSAKGRRPGQRD